MRIASARGYYALAGRDDPTSAFLSNRLNAAYAWDEVARRNFDNSARPLQDGRTVYDLAQDPVWDLIGLGS